MNEQCDWASVHICRLGCTLFVPRNEWLRFSDLNVKKGSQILRTHRYCIVNPWTRNSVVVMSNLPVISGVVWIQELNFKRSRHIKSNLGIHTVANYELIWHIRFVSWISVHLCKKIINKFYLILLNDNFFYVTGLKKSPWKQGSDLLRGSKNLRRQTKIDAAALALRRSSPRPE